MNGGNNEELVLLFFIENVCASSTKASSAGCSQKAGTAQDRLTDPGIPVILFIAIFQM